VSPRSLMLLGIAAGAVGATAAVLVSRRRAHERVGDIVAPILRGAEPSAPDAPSGDGAVAHRDPWISLVMRHVDQHLGGGHVRRSDRQGGEVPGK